MHGSAPAAITTTTVLGRNSRRAMTQPTNDPVDPVDRIRDAEQYLSQVEVRMERAINRLPSDQQAE